MSCGDDDVMEQVKEEEEKVDEEEDEKEEIVVDIEDSPFRFSITSENTVEVAEYMDIHKYDVVIPSKVRINSKEYSVTGIADSVFYGRKYMTSIEIPSGVTSIGNYAFYDCSGLTSIEIPSSVTSIGILQVAFFFLLFLLKPHLVIFLFRGLSFHLYFL